MSNQVLSVSSKRNWPLLHSAILLHGQWFSQQIFFGLYNQIELPLEQLGPVASCTITMRLCEGAASVFTVTHHHLMNCYGGEGRAGVLAQSSA